MAACERCWAEYQARVLQDPSVNYSDVVAERDKRGGCTPEEQCGSLHIKCVPDDDGQLLCRCDYAKRGPRP